MSALTTITEIRAPFERVFDLSRSVDLHVRSAGAKGERVIAGRKSDLLELGQEVTWRGRRFGIWHNLTILPAGSQLEALFLEDYMRRFIIKRNALIDKDNR